MAFSHAFTRASYHCLEKNALQEAIKLITSSVIRKFIDKLA